MADSIITALVGMMRTVPEHTGPVNVALATFDPSRTGSSFTLSTGNTVAAHSTAGSMLTILQGQRTDGKYWVEIELTANANVEYHGIGVAGEDAVYSDYAGSDDTSAAILSYNTSGEYDWQYNAASGLEATGKPVSGTGAVMCGLFNNDDKVFFLFVRPAGGGAGAWITADPNVSMAGGFAYPAGATFAPFFCTYYQDVVAKLRAPGEFTESANAPDGVTMGWYTPS